MAIFVVFLEANVVNLSLIDLQLGLPININKNNGQDKFEVHYISKNVAKMANFRGRHFCQTLNGHNSAIFFRF